MVEYRQALQATPLPRVRRRLHAETVRRYDKKRMTNAGEQINKSSGWWHAREERALRYPGEGMFIRR